MPRTARQLIDGGTYHIYTKGNNNQVIFHHDLDFLRYVQLLSTYSRSYQLSLFHYVLMPNHVHLILRIKKAELLSKAMLGLNLTYALYYRRRYEYHGHLWQGRFRSFAVDEKYILRFGTCIEAHPVRANLIQHPSAYHWSSYNAYAENVSDPLLSKSKHPTYETLGSTASEQQANYKILVNKALKFCQEKVALPESINDLPNWLKIPKFSVEQNVKDEYKK